MEVSFSSTNSYLKDISVFQEGFLRVDPIVAAQRVVPPRRLFISLRPEVTVFHVPREMYRKSFSCYWWSSEQFLLATVCELVGITITTQKCTGKVNFGTGLDADSVCIGFSRRL